MGLGRKMPEGVVPFCGGYKGGVDGMEYLCKFCLSVYACMHSIIITRAGTINRLIQFIH